MSAETKAGAARSMTTSGERRLLHDELAGVARAALLGGKPIDMVGVFVSIAQATHTLRLIAEDLRNRNEDGSAFAIDGVLLQLQLLATFAEFEPRGCDGEADKTGEVIQ